MASFNHIYNSGKTIVDSQGIGGGKATAVHHTSVPVRGLATLPEVSMLAVYDRDFKLTLVEWPVLRRDQGANTEEKDTDG